MRKQMLMMFGLLSFCFLSGCADSNPMVNIPGVDGGVAGFWWGLCNGITAPFAFIGSLFFDNIHFYEVHNNGGWYNFGFVLGTGILFGGGGSRT